MDVIGTIVTPAVEIIIDTTCDKVSNVKRKRTIERLKKKDSVVHEKNSIAQKENDPEIPVTIEVQEDLQNNSKIDNQKYVVVLGRRNISVDLGIILSNLVEKKYPTSFFSIVLTFIAALPRYSSKNITYLVRILLILPLFDKFNFCSHLFMRGSSHF